MTLRLRHGVVQVDTADTQTVKLGFQLFVSLSYLFQPFQVSIYLPFFYIFRTFLFEKQLRARACELQWAVLAVSAWRAEFAVGPSRESF